MLYGIVHCHCRAASPGGGRWALYALSFAAVSLCAGLVYGWPALRLSLLEDDESTLSERALGAVYTAGAWSTQGGRFLFGLPRDKYGTRRTAVLALLCVVGGSLGIAFADANSASQLGASVFLVGLGSGAQLCLQPVANLFEKAGTVIASLSGAFQISGLVFLALTTITDNRRHSFTGFAAVVGVLTVLSAVMLPWESSFVSTPSTKNENANDDDDNIIAATCMDEGDDGNDLNADARLGGEDRPDQGPDGEDGRNGPDAAADEPPRDDEAAERPRDPLKQSTFRKKTNALVKLVFTVEYVALLTWFSILIVPLQYYIGSIGFQLKDRGDDTGFYTHLFSILYASAAALAPFGGYLADVLGLGFTQALATALSASSFFVLASPASLNGQAAGSAAYGIGRMLVFGMYFSNIGKRFGYANYGLLAGLGLLVSAIVSLAQYPLIALAAEGKSREVNLACGAVFVATLPYTLWLGVRERREGVAEQVDEGGAEKMDEIDNRVERPRPRPSRRQTFMASFLRRPSYFPQ